jgi:hypothetical protein
LKTTETRKLDSIHDWKKILVKVNSAYVSNNYKAKELMTTAENSLRGYCLELWAGWMTPTAHRIKVVKGKKISTMIVEGNGITIKEKQVFIVTLKKRDYTSTG